MVEPLTIILHMSLIDLNYPLNLQNFFSQLFPLITFDIIPTDNLYYY